MKALEWLLKYKADMPRFTYDDIETRFVKAYNKIDDLQREIAELKAEQDDFVQRLTYARKKRFEAEEELAYIKEVKS